MKERSVLLFDVCETVNIYMPSKGGSARHLRKKRPHSVDSTLRQVPFAIIGEPGASEKSASLANTKAVRKLPEQARKSKPEKSRGRESMQREPRISLDARGFFKKSSAGIICGRSRCGAGGGEGGRDNETCNT
jgi:hypothetical protein